MIKEEDSKLDEDFFDDSDEFDELTEALDDDIADI